MSVLDKIVAAITPPESDEARIEARGKATDAAARSPWLAMVLDHHQQIEASFADVEAAGTATERRAHLKRLALILTGHSLAEEAVLYPAMSLSDQKAHAGEAYLEQSAAKVQLAALDEMDPMSQDFVDKLGHLQGAVAHHMYREEGTWFPNLVTESEVVQSKLSSRYREEFDRYMTPMSLPMGT
ncbi:hypothetical protein BH10PSE17_BH10PSE17_01190 [soil metagenome]